MLPTRVRRLLRHALRSFESTADRARLLGSVPEYPQVLASIPNERARLRDAYEHYVTHVSTREMALSLETAAWLSAACTILRPTRVLDLGSGFSSEVFRTELARGHVGEVVTVDDDPKWLERTREHLRGKGLATENVRSLDEARDLPRGAFDLVLHDLGRMPTRAATLTWALERARPSGLVVLDDVHKADYRAGVRTELRKRGFRCVSLYRDTLDGFGRYAFLAVAPG